MTINEPLQTAVNGYGAGIFAPGRHQHSSTEPYLVAHHQILAHAAAFSVYQRKYKVYIDIIFVAWVLAALLLGHDLKECSSPTLFHTKRQLENPEWLVITVPIWHCIA